MYNLFQWYFRGERFRVNFKMAVSLYGLVTSPLVAVDICFSKLSQFSGIIFTVKNWLTYNGVWLLNTTFISNSVISWRVVVLMEGTRFTRKKHTHKIISEREQFLDWSPGFKTYRLGVFINLNGRVSGITFIMFAQYRNIGKPK